VARLLDPRQQHRDVGWPASGEQDIMERVNAALDPDWNEGSIHGIGFTGDTGLGTKFSFPKGQTAAGWHTYGMIWKKGSVAYYVDDPSQALRHLHQPRKHREIPRRSLALRPRRQRLHDSESGRRRRLAGEAGCEDRVSRFELLVDYVRLYAN
jgi:hypothetical protein